MQNLLRLGLFRDRPVFSEAAPLFGDIVVPAHLGALSPDGLWGFLRGTGAKGFFFDPMTYWFWLPPKYWLRGSEAARGPDRPLPVPPEEIRPAFRRLLEAYGLLEAASTLDANSFLAAVVSGLPMATIELQRRGAAPRTAKAVAKYAQILEIALDDEILKPSRIVAPYRPIDGDDALADQAALNRATLPLVAPMEECWSILALDSVDRLRGFDDRNVEQLGLDGFAGVGLWVGGLDEHHARADDLRRYRELARSLDRPVWLMFAGYFGVLMGFDGVQEVSHGIFYTESKRLLGPVGSGPPAERYYIEALHRFYEPTRAFHILELLPDFECSCIECPDLKTLRSESAAARSDPGRRMAWIQRLQRHFLGARKREIDVVTHGSRGAALDQLEVARRRVRAVSQSLRTATGLDIEHLDVWLRALR